jgi:hypothetical protein
MYKNLILTFICCISFAPLRAQSVPLEGTWTLESVRINLSENGMNQTVHIFNSREISEAGIPATLRFGNRGALFLPEGEETVYSYEQMIVSFELPDKRGAYRGWVENGTSLVLLSDYRGEAFQANETRLVYQKQNP